MSQYWERVERQRLLIRAEQWARSVKCIHGHSCSSMWYDTTNNTRKVVDVASSSYKSEGFKDGSNLGNDYTYDANGI